MVIASAIAELPVSDLDAASRAWSSQMGFSVDWVYEDSLAGISRDAARIFLRRRTPHEVAAGFRVTIWLNLASAAEVDELYAAWQRGGVAIAEDLRTAPYNLREFIAEDRDGNRVRVFYDLGGSAAGL